MPCPVVYSGLSLDLVWLWETCLLMCNFLILLKILMWDIQHWSLLAFGWGLVLVLTWRPLGELSPINIPWDQEFSGFQSPEFGCVTSGVQAQPHIVASRLHRPHSMEDKTPRLMVKAMFNNQEHLKKLRHSFWADCLALFEVGGLLPSFRSCSIRSFPHADEFLMYMFWEIWSPHLIPPQLESPLSFWCFNCKVSQYASLWV